MTLINGRLSDLFVLKLLAQHHAGDHATAQQTALAFLRLADRWVRGSSCGVELMYGFIFQGSALFAFEHLAKTGITDPMVLELLNALSQEPDVVAAFETTIAADFAYHKYTLLNPNESEWITHATHGGDAPLSILVKPRATINDIAETLRIERANASLPKSARREVRPVAKPQGLARYSSNALGKHYQSEWVAGEPLLLRSKDQSLGLRRLLLTKLALMRYHSAHSDLPSSLDELVPDYLDAIPLDPYDDKPVRYHASRAIVWLIGEDLVDDGGATARSPGKRIFRTADPTLFIHPQSKGP